MTTDRTPGPDLVEGNAFDVARSLRFHAHTLRLESASLDSMASYIEHRYLNGERSDA